MKTNGTIRTSWLDWTAMILVLVGALNWGLVGLGSFLNANWNLVTMILGGFPTLEALVYVAVGLAGVYELYFAYQLYAARTERPTPERKTAL